MRFIFRFLIISSFPMEVATHYYDVVQLPTINNKHRSLSPKGHHDEVHHKPIQLNFQNIKQYGNTLLSLIRHRYELDGPTGSQFFLTANNMGRTTWDLLKCNFALKILSSSSTTNQTFLMVFGGSSATAGHDSYFNQSYPLVFYQRMKPLFELLGIDLIVRNIAQGANNCSPYILCYESMGGLNPDFVGWEQSYNCGRDDQIFETAARIGTWSLNKGVIYYSASGAWSPIDCPPSPAGTIPYSSEDWSPIEAGLSRWNPTHHDITNELEILDKYYNERPSNIRFTQSFRTDYKGVGMHGFNVWEKNKFSTCTKDGKNITDCSGIDAAQKCDLKFMTHEAGLYGSDTQKGANWHPTRGFHLLRGEALTWLYTLILMDTVYVLEHELSKRNLDDIIAEYTEKLNVLQPSLPPAKKCSGTYQCTKRPVCFTDYKPHYPHNMTLSEIIVGNMNWTYEAEEYGEWSLHYGYLDAKPHYVANGPESGYLNLAIKVGNTDVIWLCSPKKNGLVGASIYLDKNSWNTSCSSINEWDEKKRKNYDPSEHSSKRIQLKDSPVPGDCMSFAGIPPGNHILNIAPSGPNSISHVITWPYP